MTTNQNNIPEPTALTSVARARELLAKATPGPWWLLNEYTEPWEEGDEWHVYGRVGNRIPRVVDNSEDQLTWADAELIAAAPTLLAELADDVESERSLRIQMARELLVLTRAAELPDPSAEDFGGVGKRILAALGVES